MLVLTAGLAVVFSGCATTGTIGSGRDKPYWERIKESNESRKARAAARPPVFSGEPGSKVVAAGYRIACEEKRIIKGSCWDFVNVVYNEAGYPQKWRTTVFEGKREGPYADPDLLKPGDWVMHWNLEYTKVNYEHSSIFVEWKDREGRVAKTLDYAGLDRLVPGKYTYHSYLKIFGITRPKQ